MGEFISKNPEDTVEFGRRLGSSLQGGEVILLSGELGSGKTVLTKGIALGVGVNEVITSPSFSIVNLYVGRLELCHADFYRIEDAGEMEDLLENYLYRDGTVTVIEWGEPLLGILQRCVRIFIVIVDDNRVLTTEVRP